MLREIRLSGSIESIHLHDGQLDVVIEGNPLSFPVMTQVAPAPKPSKPPRQAPAPATPPADAKPNGAAPPARP